MRCWKYILKRKTPTIILTSIPVLFMLKLSMSASVGIVIINESCVRSGFTPALFLPQKNHHPRCIPPRTALSECPTARRKHTQWRHPHGCRQCSSDGTAWDQCPDTANFPVARRYASIVAGSRSSCRKYTANRMISLGDFLFHSHFHALPVVFKYHRRRRKNWQKRIRSKKGSHF